MKVKKILKAKPKDFPLNSKLYSKANAAEDEKEKRENPKAHKKLKEIAKKMNPHELEGHINKAGKITVSAKVPKNLRKQVAKDEKVERNYILKRKKK